MKNRIKSIISICLSLALLSSVGINTVAASDVSIGELSVVTVRFVAESDYEVIKDSIGEPVILLTRVEELNQNSRSSGKSYVSTTVAVVPTDDEEMERILEDIALLRGSGNMTEDEWFYASSLYLKSTVSFTTTSSGGFVYIGMDKVTIEMKVNSGTTITSASLYMVQYGIKLGGGTTTTQKVTYDATTTRTFNAPTSWVKVLHNGLGTLVGANLTAYVSRPGGASSNFSLPNTISQG